MSLERELLQRCLDEFDYKGVACNELCIDINKLLAQPVKYQFTTRLDQESVMYQYRDKLDGKDWGRWNLCNKIDYEDYKNNPTFQHWTYQTRKLLAQPETEQEPVAWKVIDGANGEFMFSRVKPMQRTYKYDVVIPLYSAPISDITGEELMKQVKTNRVFYQEGYAQAERDLKHKTLSDEEIILAYRKLIKKYIKNEMG